VEDLDVRLVPLVGGPVAVEGGRDHVEDEGKARVLGDGPVGEEIIQDSLISTCFVESENQKLRRKNKKERSEKEEKKEKEGRRRKKGRREGEKAEEEEKEEKEEERRKKGKKKKKEGRGRRRKEEEEDEEERKKKVKMKEDRTIEAANLCSLLEQPPVRLHCRVAHKQT